MEISLPHFSQKYTFLKCNDTIVKESLKNIGNQFIHQDILNEIKTFKAYTSFSICNFDVCIFFKSLNKINEKIENDRINIIKKIIYTVYHACCSSKNVMRKIYIYNSDFIKTYDYNITPFNVNGGLTVNNNIIYVYRKEELGKVLIHELLHAFDITIHRNLEENVVRDIEHSIATTFNKYDILVNEAHVDAITLYINTFLYASWYNKNFKQLWKYELKHSKSQMRKMLQTDFMINNTNCIAYYILKPFIMDKLYDKLHDKTSHQYGLLNLNKLYDVSCFSELLTILNDNKNDLLTQNKCRKNKKACSLRMSKYDLLNPL